MIFFCEEIVQFLYPLFYIFFFLTTEPWHSNQGFRLKLDAERLALYPALFRITGRQSVFF